MAKKHKLPRKIFIPHLYYTVRVRRLKGKDKKKYYGYVVHDKVGHCTLFLADTTPDVVAHELVHVLQVICKDFSIDFEKEREHMGYLMGFMMQRLMGTLP